MHPRLPRSSRPADQSPAEKVGGARTHKLSFYRSFFKTLFSGSLKLFLILSLWGGAFATFLAIWYGATLPDLGNLQEEPRKPSLTILDESGEILATYGHIYGQVIPAQELPAYVIHAFLATEDRRFYQHWGVDPLGIIRAFWANYKAGIVVQGGSTITQQLAKNLLQKAGIIGTYDRSFGRKIKEALLALKLEYHLSKNQILTLYLNQVYFGGGTYGIEGASMRYFQRSAKELSVYEAAMLAGLLKAPSRYSPTKNPKLAENRTRQVLNSMVEAGFLSQEGLQAALAMATNFPDQQQGGQLHYFTDWVADSVYALFPEAQGDLEVVTTIDREMQEKVEQKAKEVMNTLGKTWNASQLSFVLMDKWGSVKAMLGGLDYRKSQFNRATQAMRQAGSAFKFFTFATAFQTESYAPDTLISDALFRQGNWAPGNYRYRAKGEVSLIEAFAWSANSVAVRLAAQLGVQSVIRMARRLGISTPLPKNLTLALGSGEVSLIELTGAFATVVNEGARVVPHGIKEVRNNQGEVLYRRLLPQEKVLSSTATAHMKQIMSAVVAYGTGRAARLESVPAHVQGGKTGTSQAYRDGWFVGFAQSWVAGAWCGCDDGKSMTRVPGGSPAVHLWKKVMSEAIAQEPEAPQGESPSLEETHHDPVVDEDELDKEEGLIPENFSEPETELQ